MDQPSLFGAAPTLLAHVDWTPTREAGLARLGAFVPHAGRAYARDRNVDRGPDDRSNVSALSPWIRRRLLTEEEAIAAALAAHGHVAAEKFIQEVCWRTYWKGWLQLRPEVLKVFEARRRALKAQLIEDKELRARVEQAIAGRTSIDAFDAWARELLETGYLHNHARMWFASIWIFTLRLPWVIGADHFFKHLIDADAASNTLSWRWVAGLQTLGKHYLARAENIRTNTLGRFDPSGLLDERAPPLPPEDPTPALRPLAPASPAPTGRVCLLVHEDDLRPETWALAADVAGVAVLTLAPIGDPHGPAARFTSGALKDAAARAGANFGARVEMLAPDAVASWAAGLGVSTLVTAEAPAGRAAWALEAMGPQLLERGVRLARLRRAWDARAWPLATAGFFKFRAQIPALVAHLSRAST